jgi:thiamine-monophosphate kinase
MRLSKAGEFRLIRSIRSLCGKRSNNILLEIGDDAAAVKSPSGTMLLAADMMLEGVHFDLSYTSYFQLGYKVLAVNVSDIFAMGGKPRYFLLSLGIPGDPESKEVMEIYRGIQHLADMFGVSVVGGDTCASLSGLVLSGTLTGEAARPISRKSARPGDGIYITGSPGDSAMGLELLRTGMAVTEGKKRVRHRKSGTDLPSRSVRFLVKKHLLPRLSPLKRRSRVTSMIDISDGLLMDLGHICDESGVGARIFSDLIPLSGPLVDICTRLGRNPLDYALTGGEDLLLLLTSPSKTRKDAVRIGEITEEGRSIVYPGGRQVSFRAGGYEHFRKKSDFSCHPPDIRNIEL